MGRTRSDKKKSMFSIEITAISSHNQQATQEQITQNYQNQLSHINQQNRNLEIKYENFLMKKTNLEVENVKDFNIMLGLVKGMI